MAGWQNGGERTGTARQGGRAGEGRLEQEEESKEQQQQQRRGTVPCARPALLVVSLSLADPLDLEAQRELAYSSPEALHRVQPVRLSESRAYLLPPR